MLLPFFRGEGFTDEERKAVYGISNEDVVYADSLATCDLVILTMSWNYYKKNNCVNLALELIKHAAESNKVVWIYISGDFGMHLPHFKHAVIFRHGGNRSKLRSNHIGLPVFIRDPLSNIFEGDRAVLHNTYNKTPSVGFCGQAPSSKFIHVKEHAKVAYRNLKYHLGVGYHSPQPVQSSSRLRYKALLQIEKSQGLNSNFLRRNKYRAGAVTGEARRDTMMAYFENMVQSNYILCIRGAGNFSVRFYETLAMGRIPVLLDTDCLLPLASEVDWSRHLIIVKENHLKHLNARITSYHKALSKERFEAISISNRTLWEKKLRFGAFFKTILSPYTHHQ